LRVLAQSKAEKRKMGPHYDAPVPTEAEAPPVALLVSESTFTRGCLLTANASPLPFLLVHLPPTGPGELGAIFGNPALVSARGVLRGKLEIRWEHGAPFVGNGRPRLWWHGQPLPSWTPDADALLTQPSS